MKQIHALLFLNITLLISLFANTSLAGPYSLDYIDNLSKKSVGWTNQQQNPFLTNPNDANKKKRKNNNNIIFHIAGMPLGIPVESVIYLARDAYREIKKWRHNKNPPSLVGDKKETQQPIYALHAPPPDRTIEQQASDLQSQSAYTSDEQIQLEQWSKNFENQNHRQHAHISNMYEEYICQNSSFDSPYTLRIQSRHQALQAVDQTHPIKQNYNLSFSVQDLLKRHGLDMAQFTLCYGNAMQHQVHKECIAILDHAVDLEPRTDKELSFCLPEFAYASSMSNREGNLQQALMIADFCWSVIDGVKKFGRELIASEHVCSIVNGAMQFSFAYRNHAPVTKEMIADEYDAFYDRLVKTYQAINGVDLHLGSTIFRATECIVTGDFAPYWKGVTQAGGSMYHLVSHPIDSTVNIVGGAALIAYHLGKVIVNIVETELIFMVDPVHGIVRTKNMLAKTDDLLIHGCEKFQEIPEDELITHATALGVEMASMHYGGIALGKLLTAAGAAARISGFLEKVRELLEPIKKELEQICKTVKKSFKAEPTELAFAAEGSEAIGSGVRSATQGMTEGAGEAVTTVQKIKQVIKTTLAHIFSDEAQINALIEKFTNTAFKIQQHVHELGFQSVKITEKYLKHIFGMEALEIIEKSGKIKRKINGFHHDYLNRLEKSGVVQFVNKEIDKVTCIMKANGKYLDFVKDDMTFFPSTWTKEECLLKIQESLRNVIKKEFDKGRWEIAGVTSEGIEILNIIDKAGELITSYPVWK